MRFHRKLDAVSNRRARSLTGAVAVCLGLGALSACTTLLGIDGDYILVLEGAGGERPAGAGGEPEVGGGGTSSGGKSPGSGGVTARDAALPEADAGLECRPGAYAGTFDGTHSTVQPVIGAIQVNITNPRLSFRLEGTGTSLQIVDGAFQGEHTFGMFDGALSGAYDCTTRKVTGAIAGNFAVSLVKLPFEGAIEGDLVGGTLSGIWNEHETLTPASTGQGNWSASRTGP